MMIALITVHIAAVGETFVVPGAFFHRRYLRARNLNRCPYRYILKCFCHFSSDAHKWRDAGVQISQCAAIR